MRLVAAFIAVVSLLLMGGAVGYGLGYRAGTINAVCKAVEKARPDGDNPYLDFHYDGLQR